MWFDRSFFPYCPACGKVVYLYLPPPGGRGRGVLPRCNACGAERVFPPAPWGLWRRLGFGIYVVGIALLVCAGLWLVPLLMVLFLVVGGVTGAAGWRPGRPLSLWLRGLTLLGGLAALGPAGRRRGDGE